MNTEPYRIKPGQPVQLSDFATDTDGGMTRVEARAKLRKLHKRLFKLQELLYASASHGLLVVFQAMDTGGKDSTVRRVFGPLDPQGLIVTPFKAPTAREYSHDFLWRVHMHVPAKGHIAVFNRSHYEDVLIAKIRQFAPLDIVEKRFDHINNFERLLTDEGCVIVKFYLHISKEYQKKRLERRLTRPDKAWKFEPADLPERSKWDEYRVVYEDSLTRCNTDFAPWYIVPGERRWFRDVLVAQVLVDTLEKLNLKYPEPKVDTTQIKVV
ncbi:MAG: polyphosphate kinase 2 family protein [Phycisphaera sp.]|nr:polyphosphate kinase 2 family protein [Phycisphaera sp.]